MIVVKSERELTFMREAGIIVQSVFALMQTLIKPGISTHTLDAEAEALIRHADALPSFKGYG
jgi:methionyl aminopeptidase